MISSDDGHDRHQPDIVRSAFALLALNTAGKPVHDPSVEKGLDWLLRIRNHDGGWGYAGPRESHLFPTCIVLRALLRLHGAGNDALQHKLSEPIEKALAHLHYAYRNAGGSFGREADLVAAHSLYAIRALRLARDQGFKVERRDIEDAVAWIGQQGSSATRWVDESITISDKDSGPYTFTHVTPALYLDAFGADLSASDVIARESMIAMHDDMDPISCGMSGKRPVSWATAKSLIGFAAVRSIFHDFPERELTTGQAQGRQYLLLFLLAILCSATIVSLAGKNNNQFVAVALPVMLASLLVYGYISEQSFLRAMLAEFRLRKKVAKE